MGTSTRSLHWLLVVCGALVALSVVLQHHYWALVPRHSPTGNTMGANLSVITPAPSASNPSSSAASLDGFELPAEAASLFTTSYSEPGDPITLVPLDFTSKSGSRRAWPVFVATAYLDTRPLLMGQSAQLIIVAAIRRPHAGWWRRSGALTMVVGKREPGSPDQVEPMFMWPADTHGHGDAHSPPFESAHIVALVSREVGQTLQTLLLDQSVRMVVTLVPSAKSRPSLANQVVFEERWIYLQWMPVMGDPRTASLNQSQYTWMLKESVGTNRSNQEYDNLSGPLAVCVAPVRGNLYAQTFRSWIEYQRLMGVSTFLLYNHSIPSGSSFFNLVLNQYEQAKNDLTNPDDGRSILRWRGQVVKRFAWVMPPGSKWSKNMLDMAEHYNSARKTSINDPVFRYRLKRLARSWMTLQKNHGRWLWALQTTTVRVQSAGWWWLDRNWRKKWPMRYTSDPNLHPIHVSNDFDLHYYGQTLALNDCSLRTAGWYRWMGTFDLDEYPSPRTTPFQSYHAHIHGFVRRSIEESIKENSSVPMVASMGFRNVFHCLQCKPTAYFGANEVLEQPDCKNSLQSYLFGQSLPTCRKVGTTPSSAALKEIAKRPACLTSFSSTGAVESEIPADQVLFPLRFYGSVRALKSFPPGRRSKYFADPLITFILHIHLPRIVLPDLLQNRANVCSRSLSQEVKSWAEVVLNRRPFDLCEPSTRYSSSMEKKAGLEWTSIAHEEFGDEFLISSTRNMAPGTNDAQLNDAAEVDKPEHQLLIKRAENRLVRRPVLNLYWPTEEFTLDHIRVLPNFASSRGSVGLSTSADTVLNWQTDCQQKCNREPAVLDFHFLNKIAGALLERLLATC